ncbi:NADH-quinone oxidoreductase subunit L [Actinocorallia sp. A-T 12471]|uniref:NADH-quinone oxidoreductase subunit L n=1 Tax=Actinocorallia sp. A-T 12471 TaxID=3089813 RepID=UPI0029D3285C|nr:NADH-quinone oxidoreductase subunit L [Actinocorallia sp. A-T 12471]MDX6741733.1 NADH-quinone oxidoreductase subunit L [Actinocorallia sp. A-T 12471]
MESHILAATGLQSWAGLLIALPLLGAAVLLLGGRATDKWGHYLATLLSGGAFVLGFAMFWQMLGYGAEERARSVHLYQFFKTGDLSFDLGILLDQLSISFVLLITFVGTLIHIYSIGYMAHDANRRRFFAYLNLFISAMLLLVLSDNYLGLFIGWEGVGLASYLLIGFWQHKPTAAVAAKKAFVVNRVGDIGLVIALGIMVATFGSLAFEEVFGAVSGASQGVMTALGLMLLLGACGKSAQLPLQSWLLDAMEGPTPVSALIHAATMVTAGVYLIVRSGVIFEASAAAQTVVAIVGAATLLAGAIIGCAKDDIKKALAGSTMSQIGYMVLAAGLGPVGYVVAIAHLIAHGFFKAGMFLGAGSVMHAMKDDVDMRKYGALRTSLKITFVTFFFGYLAIIGVPPFSGFFTKDGIIEAAWHENTVLGICTIVGAAITAFYMSRLIFMTFFGKARWDDDAHPHESPPVMWIPLVVLAVGSIGMGGFLMLGDRFGAFLEPVTRTPHTEHDYFSAVGIVTLALVVVGVVIAWFKYGAAPVPREAPRGSWLTTFARRDLYGDALNESLLMRPGQWLTRLSVWFDNRGVDGVVNGLAAGIGGTSGRVRRLQTGFVRSYALSMFLGAGLLVAALLVVRI